MADNLEKTFLENWKNYQKNVNAVINEKINFLEADGLLTKDGSSKNIQELTKNIINELASEKCQEAMKKAVKDYPSKIIVELLNKELQFFSVLAEEIKNENNVNKVNFVLNSAHIIKGSIEKTFRFPSLLKKLLEILNELLGIVNGNGLIDYTKITRTLKPADRKIS